MNRRDELSYSNKPTEYFNELEKDGNKASDIEYMARTFYGYVNVLMKQKNLNYTCVTKIGGLNANMLPKYMTLPYKKDPDNPNKLKKNDKHREPNLGAVLVFSIGMQLNIDELNNLLDSANLAPLKKWRFFRGDDIILKYYDKIINELKEKLKTNPICENGYFLSEVFNMNSEFAARGLTVLDMGMQYSREANTYEKKQDKVKR